MKPRAAGVLALLCASLCAGAGFAGERAAPQAAGPAVSQAAEPAPKNQTEPEPIARFLEKRLTGRDPVAKAKEILSDVVDDGDNVAVADLGEERKGSRVRNYTFFATTLLPAWLGLSREVLTDYTVFKEIVPFVNGAEYDAKARVLDLRGGIWGFYLHSLVRFTERHERWIQYEIIGGSFRGLKGDLVFESRGEKGTVVVLTGDLEGTEWPPALVMEQGAILVLTRTAANMKSYIIDKKRSLFDPKASPSGKSADAPKGSKGPEGPVKETDKNGEELPQPRNRL